MIETKYRTFWRRVLAGWVELFGLSSSTNRKPLYMGISWKRSSLAARSVEFLSLTHLVRI